MARSVRPGATGVGRYAANLIDALSAGKHVGELFAFVTRDAPRTWARTSIREVRAPFSTPNEISRALWEQTVVPAQASAFHLDVYHCPNYILPSALACPAVVTFHDLVYLNPKLHRLTSHLYLSMLSALAARKARAIVAVSEYTRRALERRYPHVKGRVEVIYQGPDPTLRPAATHEMRQFKEEHTFTRPYVLFVGTHEPRKNLPRLVRAFERLIHRSGLPHDLVLVGPRGWRTEGLEATLATSPLAARIRRIGYVPDVELRCWYQAADAFVYPSLEEGFGLPPLEAMALGVPTVTSNTSALPEVVGEAAVTVCPTDEAGLADALEAVLTDRALADRLRIAGPLRAARFSWAESARRYAGVYERIATGGCA